MPIHDYSCQFMPINVKSYQFMPIRHVNFLSIHVAVSENWASPSHQFPCSLLHSLGLHPRYPRYPRSRMAISMAFPSFLKAPNWDYPMCFVRLKTKVVNLMIYGSLDIQRHISLNIDPCIWKSIPFTIPYWQQSICPSLC